MSEGLGQDRLGLGVQTRSKAATGETIKKFQNKQKLGNEDRLKIED